MSSEDMRDQLRHEAREKRLALSSVQIEKDSTRVIQKIQKLFLYNQVESLGLYWPVNNEVDLRSLLAVHPNCYLPKVVAPQTPLQFVRYVPHMQMITKAGVLQPADTEVLEYKSPCDITWIFVPVLACDANGHRLGSGHGYYDRTFSKPISGNPVFIGVAHDCQVFSEVPRAPWDLKLDMVITPAHTFLCSSNVRVSSDVV